MLHPWVRQGTPRLSQPAHLSAINSLALWNKAEFSTLYQIVVILWVVIRVRYLFLREKMRLCERWKHLEQFHQSFETILLDITAKCVIDMPVASDQGRYEVPFRVLLW